MPDLTDIIRRLTALEREHSRGSEIVRVGSVAVASNAAGDGTGGDGPGGTGGTGCCCAESLCLRVDGLETTTITPDYYQFTPSSLYCWCNPSGDEALVVKQYATSDPNIWESAPIQCKTGTAADPCDNDGGWTWHEPGTNTATWTWTKTSPCTNTRTWIALYQNVCASNCRYHAVSDGMGGWNAEQDVGTGNDCEAGCSCPPPTTEPDNEFWTEDPQCVQSPITLHWYFSSDTNAGCCTPSYPAIAPTTYGETTTTDCEVGDETWAWVLTSETDPGTCTPLYPDFDGTVEDETTETECDFDGGWTLTSQTDEECCEPPYPDFDGEADDETTTTSCEVAEGDTLYGASFWRLSKFASLDYWGCNQTKEEFIVDGVVKLTYYLHPNGCHASPFVDDCVNTFHLWRDAKPPCLGAPTTICLEPVLESGVRDCAWCKDNQMPKTFVVMFHNATDYNLSTGAFDTPRDFGPFILRMNSPCGYTPTCWAISILDAWGNCRTGGLTGIRTYCHAIVAPPIDLGELAIWVACDELMSPPTPFTADINLATEGCLTPFTLSASSGWPGSYFTFYPVVGNPLR